MRGLKVTAREVELMCCRPSERGCQEGMRNEVDRLAKIESNSITQMQNDGLCKFHTRSLSRYLCGPHGITREVLSRDTRDVLDGNTRDVLSKAHRIWNDHPATAK